MASRQTELRRYVKYMISDMLNRELDCGVDYTWEASELGFPEDEIIKEIRRQAKIFYDKATRP